MKNMENIQVDEKARKNLCGLKISGVGDDVTECWVRKARNTWAKLKFHKGSSSLLQAYIETDQRTHIDNNLPR